MKALKSVLSMGAVAAATWLSINFLPGLVPNSAAQVATPATTEGGLTGEINHLKTLIPDQSHVMADVALHFTNAWFAGQAKNWPLAKFYADETQSHLGWAVRMKPVRKGAAKNDIPLQPYADALIGGPLKELKASIEKEDSGAFAQAYTATLNACYACHVASEKPYLRLHIPERPALEIIQFSAEAKN